MEIERVPGEVYPTSAQIRLGNAKEDAKTPENLDSSEIPGETEPGSHRADGQQESTEDDIVSAGAAAMSGHTGSGMSGDAEEDGAQESAETGAAKQTETVSIPVSIPSDAVSYVVRTGETLYGICMEKYHSLANMQTICAWNQLGDGSHLAVGQKIYLPPEINP